MFKYTHRKDASAKMRCLVSSDGCCLVVKKVVSPLSYKSSSFALELAVHTKAKLHSQLWKALSNRRGSWVWMAKTSVFYLMVFAATNNTYPPVMEPWTALGMMLPLLLNFKVQHQQLRKVWNLKQELNAQSGNRLDTALRY